MGKPLRVLVVEDSPDDTELLVRELRKGGYDPEFQRVETAEAMRAALEQDRWDLVVSDYSIPNFSTMAAMEIMKNKGIDLPFIMVSGTVGEDVAVMMMKSGVHDYIMKSQLKRLLPAVERELREAQVRRLQRDAEQALRDSEARYRALAHATSQIVWTTDPEGKVVGPLPAWQAYTGQSDGEIRGHGWVKALHPDDVERTLEVWQHALRNREIYRTEYRIRRRDGEYRLFVAQGVPVLDPTGDIREWVGACTDITERRRMEEQLIYEANHDSLTRLPNRTLFNDRLQQALIFSHRHKKPAAVLYMDLDRFKRINDTLGHHVGDQLLQSVADRLRACVRNTDTLARHGGDEFAIVLSELRDASDIAFVLKKIQDALAQPLVVANQECFMTFSIGVAIYPNDGQDASTLLKNADIAMYRAKENGRNNYHFYTPELDAEGDGLLSLETDLRRALKRQEFRLHYQPRVNVVTGFVDGVEALIRWQHPEKGLVSPADFIPLLEETGLIVPVGEWVLRRACNQLREWQSAGFAPLIMAVNLSGRQFHDLGLVDNIRRIISEEQVAPEMIELEITESTIMRDAEANTDMLKQLNAMGLKLAIDDFGTGYSSLSYLRHFPIDTLKVDRSFIRDVLTDPDDAAVTSAIISLGHTLKMTVVAEGVETKEQLAFLQQNRCDAYQGFLFSKPLPPEQLTLLLCKGKSPA